MEEVIEHLERMAETLDGVDEENWLDTPNDIAQIYRSVANEIKQKMAAQNQSVTNCNQLQPNKVENAKNNLIRLNAYKMRDALRKVISLYKSWASKALSSSEEIANDYLMCACHVAMDALSESPRNCDRFANDNEAKKAFIVWYNTLYDLSGDDEVSICDFKHNIDGILHEYIKWLFAEAEG